jgi:hypothetical protein
LCFVRCSCDSSDCSFMKGGKGALSKCHDVYSKQAVPLISSSGGESPGGPGGGNHGIHGFSYGSLGIDG